MEALKALLNTPVTLASGISQSTEAAPSIVSAVTRHDIEAYGARDLSDVLQLVPGFQFGLDISSTIGLGFHGANVHEGKVLIMIDGVTVNDPGFGNFNFFGSVPASMIEKVEIIRGPGSALYGGFAEAAVINVITKRAGDDGSRLSLAGSTLGGGATGYTGGLDLAGSQGPDVTFAVSAGYMSGPNNRGAYADALGSTLFLDRSTANREWEHLLFDAKVKNLELTFLHFKNTRMGQDGFDVIQPPVNGANLERNYNAQDAVRAALPLEFAGWLKLEPVVEYNAGTPINETPYPAALRGRRTGTGAELSRLKTEVSATAALSPTSNLVAGVGYLRDRAKNVLSEGAPGLLGPEPGTHVFERTGGTRFAYFQYSHQFSGIGMTLGGRRDSTDFGDAFAPRIGLTYVAGPFNAKLLYGRGFRVPALWQAYRYDNPAPLVPEKSASTEMELGYRFTSNIVMKMNVFQMNVDNPIVFNSAAGTFRNFGKQNNRGFDVDLQARWVDFGFYANTSYSRPAGETAPDVLDQAQDRFLGFAKLKAGAGGYVKAGPFLVAPSLTYLSARSMQSLASMQAMIAAPDNAPQLLTSNLPAVLMGNLNITWKAPLKGMDLRLAIQNLGAATYWVIQPYYGAHAPLPMQSRQITLEATWHF